MTGCAVLSQNRLFRSQPDNTGISNTQPPSAAIASAHPLATQAGQAILQKGGNAFDAAITVASVLAVVEPSGSGLGGGGFWLLHRESDQKQMMLDSRETAPLAAHRDMFLDQNGTVQQRLSLDGPLAAGIPGVPAALVHLSEHYGTLSLSETLKPSITIARQGFEVDHRLLRLLNMRQQAILESKAAAEIFFPDGKPPKPGSRLIQNDLANTLEAIADQGFDGFYSGRIAQQLVTGVQQAGGIWTKEDLARYTVEERKPVTGDYQGARVVSASPPSSGGLVLLETLNILSQFPMSQLDHVNRSHLIAEAWKRAYRDRSEHMGDPDFVSVPMQHLLDPNYARALRSTIRHDLALPSRYLSAPLPEFKHGNHTTHFSVLDKHGNRVAATLSINYPFGSGFVAPGTGVVLNDEMDDFVAAPYSPNVYGLIGGSANAIEPGKRMLSSMTPTFIETADKIAILGTPGGSRIITMVCLGLLDFIEGKGPDSWVNLPRFHHQFIPDRILYEPGAFNPSEIEALQQLGHTLTESSRRYGNMQAILWDRSANTVQAASDPRGIGLAVVK
ncbi:MAG: gamma-glutamyltransferase [Gammaproteobacteria bacterium]|nr:gamma-glutamyltransferase [Gammaproteobacteria bacterium]